MKRLTTLAALLALPFPAASHEPIDWNGSKVQILLDAGQTGETMGMFTVRESAPVGPPRHVHEDAGEAFFLIEGEAVVLNGDAEFPMQAGEAAFVPIGSEHTFRFTGEDGGKILVIVAPAGFEGFFEATKHLKIPEDLDEINRISEEFGQHFTGPPLAAE